MLERQAVANGEIWRLLTGHLVHADDAHLSWNLGAFLVLSGLYELQERPGPGRYFGLIAAGALAIDAWFWWLQPGLPVYCGLSGVLNSFFAVLAVLLWRRTRHPAIALAGLAAIAKIAVEAALGAALLPTTTWTAVPGAHAAGFAAGLLLGLVRFRPGSFLGHAWAAIANRGIIPGFHAFPRPTGIGRGGGEE
ncbi:MAG: rhombosortase [Proteobacteria bacterium]|nr:rhombosortase [Pseudomonadota bacterium]